MDKVYYVYGLYDTLNQNTPFYIGKGTGKRLKIHEWYAHSGSHYNKHIQNTILKIERNGNSVISKKLIDNLTDENARQEEIIQIKYYRDLGINLCNLTDGGDGISVRLNIKNTFIFSKYDVSLW